MNFFNDTKDTVLFPDFCDFVVLYVCFARLFWIKLFIFSCLSGLVPIGLN
nr:MAG TPA: hypothetical protein [Caudoviricetes sp.]